MQRIKTWQAATLATIAMVIAIAIIWRTIVKTQQQPPIPPPFTGMPPSRSPQ
jgi:hypothetical protein